MGNTVPSIRRTLQNLSLTWVNKASIAIISLVTIPLIIGELGLDGLGIWLLILQFSRSMQLLNFGMTSSLGRFLAKTDEQSDAFAKERYLSVALIILSSIALLLALAAPFSATSFAGSEKIPEWAKDDVYWIVILAIFNVVLSLPLRTSDALFASIHRFDRLAIWEFAAQFIWVGGFIIAIISGNLTLLVLAAVYYLPFIFRSVVVFVDGMKLHNWPKIRVGLFDRRILVDILSLSGASAMITLAAMLVRQGAPMFVGFYEGMENLAILSIPLMIVFSLSPFLAVTGRLISPVASRLAVSENKCRLLSIYSMSSRYSLFVAFGFFLFSYVIAQDALQLWLGDSVTLQQIDFIKDVLISLLFSFVYTTPMLSARSILISVGCHWKAAQADLITNIIGIVAGITMMITLDMGVIGMVYGIALGFILKAHGPLLFRAANYFDIPVYDLYLMSTLRPVLILVVGLAIYESLLRMNLEYYASGGFALILFAILGWHFILEVEHKALVQQRLLALFSTNKIS